MEGAGGWTPPPFFNNFLWESFQQCRIIKFKKILQVVSQKNHWIHHCKLWNNETEPQKNKNTDQKFLLLTKKCKIYYHIYLTVHEDKKFQHIFKISTIEPFLVLIKKTVCNLNKFIAQKATSTTFYQHQNQNTILINSFPFLQYKSLNKYHETLSKICITRIFQIVLSGMRVFPPVGEGMGNFASRILLLVVGILRGVISTI